MIKIPIIDFEKEQCRLGNIYELTFDIKTNFLGLSNKIAKYLIEKSKKFTVEQSYTNAQGQLVLVCKVIKNPLPFLVVFGIIVAGSSIVLATFGLTLSKVHKVIVTPAGSTLTYGFVIIIIVVAYKVLTKGK